MSKKLYVGNLHYGTTDAKLKDAFAEAGMVEDAVVVVDRMTDRSRGFGFVTMADEAAQNAITMWNGKELDGRKLIVNEARPQEKRTSREVESGNRY